MVKQYDQYVKELQEIYAMCRKEGIEIKEKKIPKFNPKITKKKHVKFGTSEKTNKKYKKKANKLLKAIKNAKTDDENLKYQKQLEELKLKAVSHGVTLNIKKGQNK